MNQEIPDPSDDDPTVHPEKKAAMVAHIKRFTSWESLSNASDQMWAICEIVRFQGKISDREAKRAQACLGEEIANQKKRIIETQLEEGDINEQIAMGMKSAIDTQIDRYKLIQSEYRSKERATD